MNISRALTIEGNMGERELTWLAEQASLHQRIAEIGCWKGRSAMALADNTPGEVYAIDHWNGSVEHRSLDWSDPDWVAKAFHANLREHIESGKVRPFRMASLEFAREWLERGRAPFDMTFIDASHDYESVKADILAWKPLTRGLLCGHDQAYPPIHQAVEEIFGKVEVAPGTWDIWCVTV